MEAMFACIPDGGVTVAVFIFVASVLLLAFVYFVASLASPSKVLDALCAKVDTKSERHGGELVAEVLQAHGATHVFTLTGGHISPILVAAEKVGITVIDTRHEATAVFAADAYARLSGRIGVAAVTAGPGVTNTITALKNAQMAESPVLVLGGATATLLKGRGALQDIDQLSLIRPLCKYAVSVSQVKRIIPTIRTAIWTAMSGTPGPVFVELPLDVLYPYAVVKKEVEAKQGGKGILTRIVNMYLKLHLRMIFGGAFESCDSQPLRLKQMFSSDLEVKKCKMLIDAAEKPLMIVGSQAVVPASSAADVQQALNVIGVPCYLSGMARGLLGKQNRILIRHQRKEALKRADLIILAGAVCDFRLSYGAAFNKRAKVVAVNLSKEQLYKNAGIFWRPTIAVQGCVSDFLLRLAVQFAAGESFSNSSWLRSLQRSDLNRNEEIRTMSEAQASSHLNPVDVLCKLDAVLDRNTILVADGGDFVATASYMLRPDGPLHWLDPGPFGTLGVGAGFALGAKACNPECNVIIVFGDGSLGYSLMEFDTFIRHKVPVVAVVGNDACWRQIEREQVPLFKSDVACRLRFSDYDAAAVALGARGVKIHEANKDDMLELFRDALDTSKSGVSTLLNVLICKSDFRSGSISV